MRMVNSGTDSRESTVKIDDSWESAMKVLLIHKNQRWKLMIHENLRWGYWFTRINGENFWFTRISNENCWFYRISKNDCWKIEDSRESSVSGIIVWELGRGYLFHRISVFRNHCHRSKYLYFVRHILSWKLLFFCAFSLFFTMY